jgi:hypothetical protein
MTQNNGNKLYVFPNITTGCFHFFMEQNHGCFVTPSALELNAVTCQMAIRTPELQRSVVK